MFLLKLARAAFGTIAGFAIAVFLIRMILAGGLATAHANILLLSTALIVALPIAGGFMGSAIGNKISRQDRENG